MQKNHLNSLDKHHRICRYLISAFFLCPFLILSGCKSNTAPSLYTPDIAPTETIVPSSTQLRGESTATQVPGNENELQETDETSITATATPDIRLNPADWKNWPVVPTLSLRAKEIYLSGLGMGRSSTAFSKVGDCQSIREVLLGIYDLPGRYVLLGEDEYLQETIDNFKGSFNRDGYAVKGGFNAATVLSPIWADPEICLAGETPLTCEFRVNNPSMVIISLEVWWDGRTPERYEQYMRKIIEYSISQGILPILSTKADNVEGDHSINAITAQLAYEYDIPLWNFWLAAQALPFQGIDPDRDGFHITVDAWNERSYTALKTLDQLWHVGSETSLDEISQQPTPTLMAAIESELDFSKKFQEETGLSGDIIFELAQNNSAGRSVPAGIYHISFEDNTVKKIIPGNNSLLDAGNGYIIVHDAVDGNLKLLDYSGQQVFILKSFNYQSGGALVISDQKLILMGSYNDLEGIWLLDTSSFTYELILPLDTDQSTLQFANDVGIYWVEKDECDEKVCSEMALYHFTYSTNVVEEIIIGGYPKADPSGSNYLYYLTQDDIESIYFYNSADGITQYIGLFGNVLLDYEWSPDGSEIAVLKMERSDYFGKATEVLHYIVNIDTLKIQEYSSVLYLNPDVEWSFDGTQMITTGTIVSDDDAYVIGMRIIELKSGSMVDLGAILGMNHTGYITITQLEWVE